MSTPLATRDANARADAARGGEKHRDVDVDRARRASRPRRVSFKTMDDAGEVAPTVDGNARRTETHTNKRTVRNETREDDARRERAGKGRGRRTDENARDGARRRR